jgi:YebC/PmpR family DNA-binding regulatory protein
VAGHSKWAQIKRQKAVSDAARSRVFARFARLITLESKKAGGLLSVPGLSAVITRARAANMPKDNIERAVAKGISKDAGEVEVVSYEAYGPQGVALIVEAVTDNKNRTTPEIRHLFSKQGIEVLVPGAASWAFSKNGTLYTPNEPLIDLVDDAEERLIEILEELEQHPDVQRVFTNARGYENTGD